MRVAHCVRKEERQFVDAILNVMHSAPFMYIVLVLWAISAIGLIIFVLMHSGKGTGISDMIASSMYSTQTGTSIIEKNLDRITIGCAIVFLLSLVVLMIIYPHGTITQ